MLATRRRLKQLLKLAGTQRTVMIFVMGFEHFSEELVAQRRELDAHAMRHVEAWIYICVGERKIHAIPKCPENCPCSLKAPALDKQRVKIQEPSERQSIVAQMHRCIGMRALHDQLLDPHKLLQLQWGIKALKLKVVDLFVAQDAILVRIAQVEDIP